MNLTIRDIFEYDITNYGDSPADYDVGAMVSDYEAGYFSLPVDSFEPYRTHYPYLEDQAEFIPGL